MVFIRIDQKEGGDAMKLIEISEEYAASEELLRRRIAWLRHEEAEAAEEQRRYALHRRILELQPLLRDCRQIRRLTANYYDRSYYRDERYTV